MSQPLDYRALFEALPNLNLVLSADRDFIMLAASDARLRATNARREDCIGRSIFEVFGKNPAANQEFGSGVLRASLERVLATRAPDRMAVTRYDIPGPAGAAGGFEERYWLPMNVPVLDTRGEVRYILHQTEDVTEQVLARPRPPAPLAFADERFRAALLASGSGTFNWYPDDGSLQLDGALRGLLGLAESQAASTLDLLIEQVHPIDRSSVRRAFIDGEQGHDVAVEFRLRNDPDQWLACRAKVFFDADGRAAHVAGACTDVSALKRAEEALRVSENTLRQLNDQLEGRVAAAIADRSRAEDALRQTQKMEAIGQLTGGIAHDFNNLLTGIIGSVDLARRRHHAGSVDLDRYLDAAMNSAARAAALTQRLLAFSRQQALELKPVDLNALVVSLEDLLHRTTGEDIRVEAQLTAGLPFVCMDRNQLESAIINLVINARDAMPDGGTVTLATGEAEVRASDQPGMAGLKAGDYVTLTISDTGIGMSPDVLAKAFDPFFTTKPVGQGTGLGLSMVYGYIKQSKGYIDLRSTPGAGTSVRLYLPRFHGEPEPVESATGDALPSGDGETVLVVEDQSEVRALMVELLGELGYSTLEAGDAKEALPLLESHPRIDLLLTDVGLPGMNGRQLAEVARQHRPGLKILFATGYAENAAAEDFLGRGMAIITKPFAIDALAAKVRGMLEG